MPRTQLHYARQVPLKLWLPALLAVSAAGLLPFASVRAQVIEIATPVPVVGQQPPQVAQPAPKQPIYNLKAGLDVADWDPARRAPIIALSANSVQPWKPERDPNDWYAPWQQTEPLPYPQNGSYPMDRIAQVFGRKVIRLGTLSVLAPTEMVVLNTRLPKPDPMAGLTRSEKMQLFMASMTEAQWQALASEQGLGASDLSGVQKDLFLSLLPNPLRVIKVKVEGRNSISYINEDPPGGAPRRGPVDPRRSLTDAQRNSARIRINRKANLVVPGESSNYYGTGVSQSRKPGTEYYQLAAVPEWNRPEAFGIKIRETVPSRLKIGQMDYDAPQLDPVIPLANAPTVADLMKRIREATRLEIYADGRVSKMTIDGIGLDGSARSGDILKALAWAVTGTYRRVGPVFILTDDVPGIGSRRAYVREWQMVGQAGRREIFEKAQKAIRKAKPIQYIGFAKDDPLALDDKMMKRVEDTWANGMSRWRGLKLNPNELPAEMQGAVREAIEDYQKTDQAKKQPILTDRVNVSINAQTTLIIPGLGEIEGSGLEMYQVWDSMLPEPTNFEAPNRKEPSQDPAVLPDRMKAGGILSVQPTTPEEATAVVELAKQRGLKHIWILTPLDPEKATPILKAAIAAGKERGITVSAIVRLMMAPVADPASLTAPPLTEGENGVTIIPSANPGDRDINILGETSSLISARYSRIMGLFPSYYDIFQTDGDWLLPDSPTSMLVVEKRVLAIAKIPGLAGVVFRDIAAPGYNIGDTNQTQYVGLDSGDFGYTQDRRVTMIRKEGYDPIDIAENYSEVRMELPFFGAIQRNYIDSGDGTYRPDPKQVTVTQVWQKMRYDLNLAALAALYKKLRPQVPATVPFIVQELTPFVWGGTWWGTWEAAEKIPSRKMDPSAYFQFDYETGSSSNPLRLVDEARKFSKTVYSTVSMTRWELSIPPRETDKFPPGSPKALSTRINALLDEEAKYNGTWDGLVLDLTTLPMDKVTELILGGLAAPVSKAAAN